MSRRSDLDAGEAGDGRSHAPMEVAMEMAMAATSIAAETAGATIFELLEGNENGQWRSRSEAAAAPSDRRSRMEKTIGQQPQELTQLHRTVGHQANLWKVRAAHEEAQWQGMMAWMPEREQEWEARHEDDKLWGAGIKHMIAKVMKGVAPRQEEGDKEREVTVRTDSGGIEATQHADTTREEGPERRQQLQQQPKPKLQLKLQPQQQPAPKPRSAPTPVRRWETIPPLAKSQRASVRPGPGPGPGPAPTHGSCTAERRLLLKRDESVLLSNRMDQEIE